MIFFQGVFLLGQEYFDTRHARSCQRNDKGDVRIVLRGDQRDQSSFAVSGQSDLRRVDFGPVFQITDAFQYVAGEILGCSLPQIPGRLAASAVVHAQYGDSAASQVVGDHAERLVIEQRFVPVLPPAAGDQQCDRKSLPFFRQRQRGAVADRGVAVVINDILFGVGERRLRVLRAQFDPVDGFAERQREFFTVVMPFAYDAVRLYFAFKISICGFLYPEYHAVLFITDRRRIIECALCRDIHLR